jgi:hypothetical protein
MKKPTLNDAAKELIELARSTDYFSALDQLINPRKGEPMVDWKIALRGLLSRNWDNYLTDTHNAMTCNVADKARREYDR